MKFLIIDNYDSFVYNIAQYLGELQVDCDVIRNDKITINDIKQKNYDAIIISPGPGTPEDKKYFGICTDVIKEIGPTTPILGVCLGHQGIIHAFGGSCSGLEACRSNVSLPAILDNVKKSLWSAPSSGRYGCPLCGWSFRERDSATPSATLDRYCRGLK